MVSANEYSCAHHLTWSPNKPWRSNSIFNIWYTLYSCWLNTIRKRCTLNWKHQVLLLLPSLLVFLLCRLPVQLEIMMETSVGTAPSPSRGPGHLQSHCWRPAQAPWRGRHYQRKDYSDDVTAGLRRPPPVRREQFQPTFPLSLSIECTGHWVHLLEVFLDPQGKEREQQLGVGGRE